MAVQQIVPIFFTLQGDGSATTFTFALKNMYQAGFGGSVSAGGGFTVVPTSIAATNPPVPVTSATVDANGNITITFTSALPASNFTFEIDLIFASGGATSSSATQSQNVTLVGTSTVVVSGTIASNITQVNGATISATNTLFDQITDGTNAMGVMTNFGTTPGAVKALNINSSIFSGTTSISNTGGSLNANITNTVPVTLTSTTVTNTVSENLLQLNSVALGSPSNYGTSPGAVSVMGVNAFITNTVPVTLTSTTITGTVAVTQSTSPWVVSLTSTTVTGTVAVTQSTSPWVVSGGLTHNNAAPAANNVGVLPAVASTAAPTYTTGDQVLLSTDLAGNLRVTFAAASEQNVNLNQWAGTNLGTPTAYGTSPGAVVAGSVNAFVTNTVATTLASTTITGTVAVTQSTSPWVDNLTQVAGVALGATGVAAFGTAPSAANVMGVNASLFAGGAGLTPATFGTTAAGTGLLTNASLFIGTTVAVAASAGVQKVGISGATGVTLDAAQNAAAPANELVVGAVFNTTTPALTAGNASQLQSDSTGALQVNTEGKKQSYRCGIISFGPLASSSPTISVTGSATKTIRITRIRLSVAATAGAICDVSLKRFSTLTGGTSASQSANIAKLDTNNAAATAVVNLYTAAATTATAAGVLAAERYEIVTASVSVAPQAIEWDFSNMNAQACVLRGTGDFVGFLFSAIGTTPNGDCWIEWTEE